MAAATVVIHGDARQVARDDLLPPRRRGRERRGVARRPAHVAQLDVEARRGRRWRRRRWRRRRWRRWRWSLYRYLDADRAGRSIRIGGLQGDRVVAGGEVVPGKRAAGPQRPVQVGGPPERRTRHRAILGVGRASLEGDGRPGLKAGSRLRRRYRGCGCLVGRRWRCGWRGRRRRGWLHVPAGLGASRPSRPVLACRNSCREHQAKRRRQSASYRPVVRRASPVSVGSGLQRGLREASMCQRVAASRIVVQTGCRQPDPRATRCIEGLVPYVVSHYAGGRVCGGGAGMPAARPFLCRNVRLPCDRPHRCFAVRWAAG
jgi:hypothetical protein